MTELSPLISAEGLYPTPPRKQFSRYPSIISYIFIVNIEDTRATRPVQRIVSSHALQPSDGFKGLRVVSPAWHVKGIGGTRPRRFGVPPLYDWSEQLANQRRRRLLGALYPGSQCTAGRVPVRIVSVSLFALVEAPQSSVGGLAVPREISKYSFFHSLFLHFFSLKFFFLSDNDWFMSMLRTGGAGATIRSARRSCYGDRRVDILVSGRRAASPLDGGRVVNRFAE